MKRLFISTTNHIDNGKAVAYYGVVSSHIVAGTGFLSDLAASFSDLFGGRSGSYRRQLESLYDEALDEVSEKATALGANCILGLKIDMDNISGKGMSMFMITATGTAAKVEFNGGKQEDISTSAITSVALVNELEKRAILELLNKKDSLFPLEKWEPILRSPSKDYIIPLTKRYFEIASYAATSDINYRSSFMEQYGLFVQLTDRPLVVDAIYEAMRNPEYSGYAKDLIDNNELFDAKSILRLIKEGMVREAVKALHANQPAYSEKDLIDIDAVLAALDNLPDVGKIEVVKGGMFSKDGEKFICRHGHKNDPDREFCSDCAENIKGITGSDIKEIEIFKNKVSVLRDLLTKK